MNIYIIGIGCLIVGLIIGLIIGFFILPHLFKTKAQDSKLKQKVDTLQHNFTDYQQKVSHHLRDTSQLIDDIHERYMALQEHIHQDAKLLNLDPNKKALFEPSQYYTNIHKSLHGLKTKVAKKASSAVNGKLKKMLKPPIDYDPLKHSRKKTPKAK